MEHVGLVSKERHTKDKTVKHGTRITESSPQYEASEDRRHDRLIDALAV